MHRIWGLLVAALLAAALLAGVPGSAAAADGFSMRDRFARETSRYGDRDASTYAIQHVRELQYRLKREGLLRGVSATGYYGEATRAAVRTFQRRVGVRVSGVATHATWRELLERSNHNLSVARRRCAGAGWHVCYDRAQHQVTLWRGGRLWNSWLVRGGAYDSKTRRGNFTVYWRSKDHVSSLHGSPMPYSQFFSGGQALHGSRAMMDPFVGHSHGCVNMYVEDARQLWKLTSQQRLRVHVYAAWD